MSLSREDGQAHVERVLGWVASEAQWWAKRMAETCTTDVDQRLAMCGMAAMMMAQIAKVVGGEGVEVIQDIANRTFERAGVALSVECRLNSRAKIILPGAGMSRVLRGRLNGE